MAYINGNEILFSARINAGNGASIPTFDLAELGLANVPLDRTPTYLETDTTEIMTALEKGVVRFSLNVGGGAMTVMPNSVFGMGAWLCTIAVAGGEGTLAIIVMESGIVASATLGEAVATTIDLSAFETNGEIKETFADGTEKTTTVAFDENGNPTSITDSNGNETVLIW